MRGASGWTFRRRGSRTCSPRCPPALMRGMTDAHHHKVYADCLGPMLPFHMLSPGTSRRDWGSLRVERGLPRARILLSASTTQNTPMRRPCHEDHRSTNSGPAARDRPDASIGVGDRGGTVAAIRRQRHAQLDRGRVAPPADRRPGTSRGARDGSCTRRVPGTPLRSSDPPTSTAHSARAQRCGIGAIPAHRRWSQEGRAQS